MKLIYMGTPQFSVPPLLELIKAGHEIAGVVTRVDKPAGRGRAVAAPPVKRTALEQGLIVYQPKRVREPQFLETLKTIQPDIIVVAAFGQILPKDILSLPKYGCFNIHASLLPAYRGAAPINWAIINGDRKTGITIMQMDEGMDTGDILLQQSIPITSEDTAGTLTEKLSETGAKLICEALSLEASGGLKRIMQDSAKATPAPLLKKEDGLINWNFPATEIRNRVRGLTPWPGAYTFLDGAMIKILNAETAPPGGEAGKIYAQDQEHMDIGTGRDRLRIITLQAAGKKPMSASEFLRGHRGVEGKKFTNS